MNYIMAQCQYLSSFLYHATNTGLQVFLGKQWHVSSMIYFLDDSVIHIIHNFHNTHHLFLLITNRV